MKKYFLAVFGTLIILFILYLVLSSIKKVSVNEPPGETPTSTPTGAPINFPLPSGVKSRPNGKILINNIELKDFFATSKKMNENGDVLISQRENYSIEYFPKFNSFLIAVKASPFEENRKLAELELVGTLGISKNDACRLSVNITTTQTANPEFSGRNYPLSFCRSY